MDRTYKRFLLFSLVIIAITLIYYFGLSRYISLEQLKANDGAIRYFVSNYYILSVGLFIGLLCISVILSLPLLALFALAGGYLFGVIPGIIFTALGSTCGVACAYSLYRLFFTESMSKKYRMKFHRFEEQVKNDGANYLLMLQFLGVVPFFVINIIAVLARIPFRTLVWTTLLGSLPFITVYVLAGSQLRSVSSLSDLLSVRMVLILMLFALLAVLPVIIKRMRKFDESEH